MKSQDPTQSKLSRSQTHPPSINSVIIHLPLLDTVDYTFYYIHEHEFMSNQNLSPRYSPSADNRAEHDGIAGDPAPLVSINHRITLRRHRVVRPGKLGETLDGGSESHIIQL